MTRAFGLDLGYASTACALVEDAHVIGVRLISTAKGHERGLRVAEDDARRLLEVRAEIVGSLERNAPPIVAYEEYRVYDDRTADSLREGASLLLAGLGWIGEGYGQGGFTVGQLLAVAREQGASLVEGCSRISEALKAASRTAGRGSAAKVLMVQGLVVAECSRLGILSVPFSPTDRCVRMIGRERASKNDIIDAVRAQTTGFDEAVRAKGYSAGAVNHLADAVAHALLGVDYVNRGHKRK